MLLLLLLLLLGVPGMFVAHVHAQLMREAIICFSSDRITCMHPTLVQVYPFEFRAFPVPNILGV